MKISLIPCLYFSKTIVHDFIITEGIISNYGFLNKGILVNGAYPGPEIHMNDGDRLIVNIANRMKGKNITIHFHGIRQKYSQSSDGVPMVTQEPVQPGMYFQHDFEVTGQPGTYYYHAHTDLNAIWLHGPLIVHESEQMYGSLIDYDQEYYYDEERILVLSEAWDNTTDVLLEGIMAAPFVWLNNSRSILMNSQTYQESTAEISASQALVQNSIVGYEELVEQSYFENPNQYSVINVEQGRRYRLRLIGATDLMFLKFSIPGHTLIIIEIDGTYVDPRPVSYIQINSGQRYSCIIDTNGIEVDNYFIFADPVELPTAPLANNGIAILSYDNLDTSELVNMPANLVRQLPIATRMPAQDPLVNPLLNHWIIKELTPSRWYHDENSYEFLHPYYPLPLSLDREIFLDGTELVLPNGEMRWLFDGNQTYRDPEVPFLKTLETLASNEELSPYTKHFEGIHPNVYEYMEGEVIQIIVQNTVGSSGMCNEHPWHLHGHTFHVVGMGPGLYNPQAARQQIESNIREQKTMFRDTATIYPFHTTPYSNASQFLYPPGTKCGWLAIRYRADNPGAWFMHCHITPHMLMGKRIALIEKPLSVNIEF